MNKSVCVIEHHCLHLGYPHLRVHHSNTLEKLTTSIDHYGQLVPVVVVPEAEHLWTLIDGYQRVKALKRLGKDTVEAEVWDCPLPDALLMLLKRPPCRTTGILEEALLLQELHTQHNLSQEALATRVGHDQSWVSRRLSLVDHLPESVLKVLSKGGVSLWIGSRILAPMARAIPAHADRLLTYLLKHAHSTREMQVFYDHYQKSPLEARNRMVDHPDLFFKARRVLEAEKQVTALKEGPVGQWRVGCYRIRDFLKELILLAPIIFLRQTGEEESLKVFNEAANTFDELTKRIEEFRKC